ncbi:MAG: hypothetical protein JWQ34_2056 [Mucilaginibacter sp.]|uniref:hypothetical protein n=1 Tax=Mucilaginibacter sp. TaxID=1882438 RepID=UPI002612AA13|nr:hypothetical protein [Mucilaginibacter sp.]MDB5003831.1 hypothetical protein [Mucilaginibacter sp.]
MRTKNYLITTIIGLIFFISSCATYYIPVDSFKQQLQTIDTSQYRLVTTKGPFGDVVKYKTYPIDIIKCVDKNGGRFALTNSPALEIRFTDNKNKRTTFYFDRIFVNGNVITGSQSRFISSIRATILLDNVKTIEIQDGRKKYRYIQ